MTRPDRLRRSLRSAEPHHRALVLYDYIDSAEELRRRAHAVFAMIRGQSLKVYLAGVFGLKDASVAHAMLENRQTVGKIILRTSAN